ncbi:MAG: hypothetical protein ACR2K0_08840, partial [Acidimicrobiales bacterium]
VEGRGLWGVVLDAAVLGSSDGSAVAAGAVAAVTAAALGAGRLARTGAGGLAEMAEAVPFLAELARRGVKAATFQGSNEREVHPPAAV